MKPLQLKYILGFTFSWQFLQSTIYPQFDLHLGRCFEMVFMHNLLGTESIKDIITQIGNYSTKRERYSNGFFYACAQCDGDIIRRIIELLPIGIHSE